jgi:hypothetical protein
VPSGSVATEALSMLRQIIAAFCSPLFEIAFVLVRFDHIASLIVNANHSVM